MARASTLGFAMAVNVLIPFLSGYLRVVFDQFADLLAILPVVGVPAMVFDSENADLFGAGPVVKRVRKPLQ
jgi:hypothetical protein